MEDLEAKIEQVGSLHESVYMRYVRIPFEAPLRQVRGKVVLKATHITKLLMSSSQTCVCRHRPCRASRMMLCCTAL